MGADVNPRAPPRLASPRLTTGAARVSLALRHGQPQSSPGPGSPLLLGRGDADKPRGALLLGGCGHGLGVHVPPWGYQHLECGWAWRGLGGGLPTPGADKAWLRASALPVSPQGSGPPLRQGEGKTAPSTPPVPEQVAGFRAPSSPGPGGGQLPEEAGVLAPRAWAGRTPPGATGEPCCWDTDQLTAAAVRDVNRSHLGVFFFSSVVAKYQL